jgi:hypothetical protein
MTCVLVPISELSLSVLSTPMIIAAIISFCCPHRPLSDRIAIMSWKSGCSTHDFKSKCSFFVCAFGLILSSVLDGGRLHPDNFDEKAPVTKHGPVNITEKGDSVLDWQKMKGSV